MTAGERKKLFSLPVPKVEENPNLSETEEYYWSSEHRNIEVTPFQYHAVVVDKVLVFTVFTKAGEWQYRVFYWKTGFVTQLASQDSESRAMLHNLRIAGSGYRARYHALPGANKAVADYLDITLDKDFCGYKALRNAQKAIRKNQLDNRHGQIRENTREKMKDIRETLPKAFYRWLAVHVLKDSRYLTYQYQSNPKDVPAFCSYCQHSVKVQDPKHLEKGYCPRCKRECTYIVSGRRTHTEDNAAHLVYYLQRAGKGYAIRAFRVGQKHEHRGATSTTKLICHEVYRTLMDKDHKLVHAFEWGQFKQTGSMEWIDSEPFRYYAGHIYPHNLSTVASIDPNLNYLTTAVVETANSSPYAPDEIFTDAILLEKMRFLKKSGLRAIAKEVIDEPSRYSNHLFDKETPWEMLGVSKQELHRIAKHNLTLNQLIVYRLLKKEYGKVSGKNFDALVKFPITSMELGVFRAVMQTPEVPQFHRIINYLISNNNLDGLGLRDWHDYFRECSQLEYNLEDTAILFPNDFAAAHERTSLIVKVKVQEEHQRKLKERTEKLMETYSYSNQEYFIKVPKTVEEIIEEGKKLHHCVGGYAHWHSNGRLDILFLRKKSKPNEPFYTAHFENGELVQCRTVRNKTYTKNKKVSAFVTQWREYLHGKDNPIKKTA